MLHVVFIFSHLCLNLRHIRITLLAKLLHASCLLKQRPTVIELIFGYPKRSLVIHYIHIFLHHLNGFLVACYGKCIVASSYV